MCAQSYTLALPRHRLSQGSVCPAHTPDSDTTELQPGKCGTPHPRISTTPDSCQEWSPHSLYNTTELPSWKVCSDPGAQFPCNIPEQSVHQGWMLEPRLPHLQTQQGRAYVGGIGGKTISKRHTYFCESSPENKEKTAPFFSVPLHGTLFKGKSISVILTSV